MSRIAGDNVCLCCGAPRLTKCDILTLVAIGELFESEGVGVTQAQIKRHLSHKSRITASSIGRVIGRCAHLLVRDQPAPGLFTYRLNAQGERTLERFGEATC